MIAAMAEKAPRVPVQFPRALVRRIDDYRWRARLPSRAAAIRQLLDFALKADEDAKRAVHHQPRGQ